MRPKPPRATAAAVLAGVLLVILGPVGSRGAEVADTDGNDWRDVMQHAVSVGASSAYEGRLAIVSFDQGGPTLAEIEIGRGADGQMRIGAAETWVVGRSFEDAFYFRPEAGSLLRLGNVEPIAFDLEELTRKYEVGTAGTRDLRTGAAWVLVLRERGAEHDRERLYVDHATGIVVRRDTFGAEGVPKRVVAFTSLTVTDPEMTTPDLAGEQRRSDHVVSEDGLAILDRVGWAVPRELPGRFRLRRGVALPDESQRSSLHLIYSDGLYTLSVYEQHGTLDLDGIPGAAGYRWQDRHVWRWPGAEPERVVWSGAGTTFTAVSDAPLDVMMTAVAALPGEPPPGLDDRLGRGLARVGHWLWPFD